ncbi:hypothetical protein DAPPUDRAFT_106819 [Daphnia pulex]|uniref:Uncharacterized protein n=1 Tax=Daphnia pulex TaxID=6669 RepID=E9GV18_DAPPU|nr:hypothetical protein DAPPUDRAFT_106819 [Daphnia pulex]|eukprot:EFX76588.1 hypothetical protein DAPPUDRAFT_106819 [Daphnia pulex]
MWRQRRQIRATSSFLASNSGNSNSTMVTACQQQRGKNSGKRFLTIHHLELGCILAGYGNLVIEHPKADLLFDLSNIHVDVVGDFYIFNPEVNKELTAHLSCKHATNDAVVQSSVFGTTKFHWEKAILRRWVLSFDLKEQSVVELVMVGGRELRSVGPRKEKDLSPYVERRARGTRREVSRRTGSCSSRGATSRMRERELLWLTGQGSDECGR